MREPKIKNHDLIEEVEPYPGENFRSGDRMGIDIIFHTGNDSPRPRAHSTSAHGSQLLDSQNSQSDEEEKEPPNIDLQEV